MELLFKELRRGFQAGALAGFGLGFVAGSGVAILMNRHYSNRQVSCVIICRSACVCMQLQAKSGLSFFTKERVPFLGCGLHMYCV